MARSRSKVFRKRKSHVKKPRVLVSVKKASRNWANVTIRRRKKKGGGGRKRRGLFQKALRGDGHTWSFTRLHGSRIPAFWRIGNRQISSNSYILTDSGLAKAASPAQGILNLTRWGTPAMLETLRGYISTNVLQTFFLYSCHVEINITNFSNNPTKVWIYDFKHKKDLPQDGNLWQPNTCLTAGATEVGANIIDMGQTPFTIPMFTRNYKVTKISELMMNPGESHVHRVMNIYNRLIKADTSYWSGTTTPMAAIKDTTRGCFAMFHGGNIYDQVNQLCSVGSAEIGFTAKHVYKYSWTNDSQFNTHRLNQLAAVAAGNEHLINNENNTDTIVDMLGTNV